MTAKTPPLDVGTYVRVSTKERDELQILENQRRIVREHVERLGGRAQPYEDVGLSGGDADRPGLNALLEDAAKGKLDLVVFTSLSRMTRGGIAAGLEILRRLDQAHVGWHFTEQPILNFDASTPKLARDIIQAVLLAVDEDYRRRISEATKAAYARRKALAEASGTTLTWGRRGRGKKPGERPSTGLEKRLPPLTTEAPTSEKEGTISHEGEG